MSISIRSFPGRVLASMAWLVLIPALGGPAYATCVQHTWTQAYSAANPTTIRIKAANFACASAAPSYCEGPWTIVASIQWPVLDGTPVYLQIDPSLTNGQWYLLWLDAAFTQPVDSAPPASYAASCNGVDLAPGHAVCGNDIKEGVEQCDGIDAADCPGLCNGSCECPPPVCGNDVIELGEECEPGDVTECVTGQCQDDCLCVPPPYDKVSCFQHLWDPSHATNPYSTLQFKWGCNGFTPAQWDLIPGASSCAELDGQAMTIVESDWESLNGRFVYLDGAGVVGDEWFLMWADEARTIPVLPTAAEAASAPDPGYLFACYGGGLAAGHVDIHPCGNGTLDAGEACDDGNTSDDDACLSTCVEATCGDGYVWAGQEDCDDAGESATCNSDCTSAVCGDAKWNVTAGESCDDGGDSVTCDSDCTPAFCGDGTVNAVAGEACDDAGESAACNVDCSIASCGDAILNVTAGESCDDGGESASCDADCTLAVCGDAVVNATAMEFCDDGDDNGAGLRFCLGDCSGIDAGLCTDVPAADCKGLDAGRSRIMLRKSHKPRNDRLALHLRRVAATELAEFGNPLLDDPIMNVCVYDSSTALQPLLVTAIPSRLDCGDPTCWQPAGRGDTARYKYRLGGGLPYGVYLAELEPGVDGRTSLQIKALGSEVAAPLGLPVPDLPLELPATAQVLVDDGTEVRCWQAVFETPKKNDAHVFKAKGPEVSTLPE